jgi:hypothetical protein
VLLLLSVLEVEAVVESFFLAPPDAVRGKKYVCSEKLSYEQHQFLTSSHLLAAVRVIAVLAAIGLVLLLQLGPLPLLLLPPRAA